MNQTKRVNVKAMTIQRRPRRKCTERSCRYKDYSTDEDSDHALDKPFKGHNSRTGSSHEETKSQSNGHGDSVHNSKEEEDIGDRDHPDSIPPNLRRAAESISSPSITTAELAISEMNSPVSAMTFNGSPPSSCGGTLVTKRRGAAESVDSMFSTVTFDSPSSSRRGGTVVAKPRGAAGCIVSNSVNVDDLATSVLTVIKHHNFTLIENFKNLLLQEKEDREKFHKVIVELVLGEYEAHRSALINGTDTDSVDKLTNPINNIELDPEPVGFIDSTDTNSVDKETDAANDVESQQTTSYPEIPSNNISDSYSLDDSSSYHERPSNPNINVADNGDPQVKRTLRPNSRVANGTMSPMLLEDTPDHKSREMPLNREVSLNFSFPDGHEHSESLTILKKVNEKIEEKWKELKKMIDENQKGPNFGGTMIQSERYMISLDFGNDFTKCKCWQRFCEQVEFEEGITMMKSILDSAKQKSEDLMGDKFSEGKLGTPALIICETMEDQGFHLDIVGKDQKQFCMLLSTGSSSTIIAEPENTKNVSTYQEVTNLIVDEIRNYGFDWLEPCTELLEKIHGIDKYDDKSASGSKMKAGFGNLFKIHKRPQGRIHGGKSYKFVNCPAGACFAMDGGEIHAGAGSNKGQIRTCLFWTWSDKNGSSYDKDVQETRLSMIIHIANDCWDDLEGEDERMGIMKMIYYCFITSEVSYRKSAPGTFCDPSVEKFLEDLNRNGTEGNIERVLKLLKDHAEKLFPEDEDEI